MRLDVEQELLPGEQAFVSVEIVELNVGQRRIAELVLQRALGFLGDLKGELERFGVKPFDLALHARRRNRWWFPWPVNPGPMSLPCRKSTICCALAICIW